MAGTEIESIETDDLFRLFVTKWRNTSLGLVDSRLPPAFFECHVSGSTNVPIDDLSNRGMKWGFKMQFRYFYHYKRPYSCY